MHPSDSNGGPASEQRSGRDRRQPGLPRLRFLMLGGRRRAARRSADSRGVVLLDRYSPRLFAAMMGILVLSLLDAGLTLFLIQHGAAEINPVMNYFLRQGPVVFMIAKYLLTSMAVVIFVLLAHSIGPRPGFSVRRIYLLALLAFGGVVAWELVLVGILAVRA